MGMVPDGDNCDHVPSSWSRPAHAWVHETNDGGLGKETHIVNSE
jgi:hypothetical protein